MGIKQGSSRFFLKWTDENPELDTDIRWKLKNRKNKSITNECNWPIIPPSSGQAVSNYFSQQQKKTISELGSKNNNGANKYFMTTRTLFIVETRSHNKLKPFGLSANLVELFRGQKSKKKLYEESKW